MLTCPTCGAQNDPANRFCDQCGSRLDVGAPAVAVSPLAAAEAPTMLATPPAALPAAPLVCPNCGSPALPGEAFCDNCGADLSSLAITMAPAVAEPEPESALAPAAVEPAAAPPVAAPDEATMLAAPPVAEPVLAPIAPEPVAAPNDATILAAPPVAVPMPAPSVPEPVAAPDDATILATPEAAAPTLAAPMADEQATHAARRAELDAELVRQQQIIAQFEQMQATFGAATPAAVTTGLAEARDALDRAQAELDSLAPPAPTIDPAELQRLGDEIARQQQIIVQFEQMQATFGAATPAAVTTGLAEARDALTQAETSLAALGAGITAAPAPAAPSAPEAAPAPPAPVPAAPATAAPEPAPAPPVAPTPAPVGPRFVVVDGGTELRLPADKAEIIVGREDPVSNIYPEVDLTPFGGEMGGVSRQHARLNLSGGQWTITDLNSTNYTRLDGARLEPNTATALPDGARVQFGRIAMTFHL